MKVPPMSREYLSFDDVLIEPQHSAVRSRSDVSLKTKLYDGFELDLPIIASNMDTVCELDMAIAMSELGGLGVIHRNLIHATRIHCIRQLTSMGLASAVAMGVNELRLSPVRRYIEEGVRYIVLDIAHGDSVHALKAVEQLRSMSDKHGGAVCIIGGNVATPDAVGRMADAGAHCVKVGIGPGAACLTRINTGVGIPQLSAILECSHAADLHGVGCIADGGMKTPGDIAKALAAGADAVMLGGMLAGTFESPGDVVDIDGEKFKTYRGMASNGAGSMYIEGAEGFVKYSGKAGDVVNDISDGLRSAFSYVGASDMAEYHSKALFVRISTASILENGAHGTIT